ncbi:MAG: DUF368 domain-containing protein [Acidimicrobiia bacterium]|nr:DUF368 domain-containing protein [Acidimicrobiia bacterium]MYC44766.1 DUF368 domain-containing protein [Acidimicrobiia bacterium]MYI19598.1 DUF368 domain-containing protein [Acidimicrobiia bacterium]
MRDGTGQAAQRPGGAGVLGWAGDGLRGFCIGVADLVPGVSGSTVAVLLGVYERLLAAVRSVAGALARLLRGDPRGAVRRLRRIDWALVAPVAVGAAVALAALARAVDWLLTNRPEPTAGAFWGLVCAAVLVAAGQVRAWRVSLGLLTVAVATLGAWLFGLSATPVAEPVTIVWLGAGALGICAMILPGVSGAFVLLIIGLYASFVDALGNRDWAPIGLFAAGALAGALVFASLLSRLLTRYHDAVMATMVGLMLGSLRVLWPWPNGVGHLGGPGEVVSGTGLEWPDRDEVLWPVVCAVAAFALALAASRSANRATAGTGRQDGLLEAP